MTDREMLELAAKAAGYSLFIDGYDVNLTDSCIEVDGFPVEWNPLTDDGDALRLAVKLKMEIDHDRPADQDRWVMACTHGMSAHAVEGFGDESHRAAATRRAIVRAAAAIGEKMP